MDTNAAVDLSLEKYKEFVDVTDSFMIDMKAWDESDHRKLVGHKKQFG